MKKKIVVVLALILIASMVLETGCGKKDAPGPESGTPSSTTEDAEEEAEEPAEEAAEEAEETSAVPSELLGTGTDSSYENEFFGIKFEAPEGWYVLSDEERGKAMGIASSEINDEEILAMFESAGYAIDFYAMDVQNGDAATGAYSNLNITIQDVGKLYGMLYSEKEIAEASIATVEQALAAQGATDIKVEVGEAEFLGETCVSMTTQSKAGGIDMYQKQVYVKKGSAMACVTATSFAENKTDEMLAAFKAL